MDLRKAGRQHLSKYLQDKYNLDDLKDATKAVAFLRENFR